MHAFKNVRLKINGLGWMEKQNMVYTYNGILFNLKKESNSAICYSMYEDWGHYAKWNKLAIERPILYNST